MKRGRVDTGSSHESRGGRSDSHRPAVGLREISGSSANLRRMDFLRPLGLPTTPAPRLQKSCAPAPPADPVDTAQVRGPAPFRPAADAALAVSAAVRSGVAGAGGPVLERELQALQLPLLKTKWLRLPFTDRHKIVSAEEAAEFLNEGKGQRVHVDLGSGPRPLASPDDLAALLHLRDLSTDRSAPAEARLLKPFAVAGEKAEPLNAYDGYLRLKAHEPVALLHEGVPMLKGADTAAMQAGLPAAARGVDALVARAVQQGVPAMVPLFRHVVTVIGEDPEALARVLPDMAIPHQDAALFQSTCVEMLKAGLPPAEVAARQEVVAGPGYAARLAFLKPFGLTSPDTPIAVLQAAEDAVRALIAANLSEAEARAAAEAVRGAVERARRKDLAEMLGKLASGGLAHLDEFRGLVGDDLARASFDRAVRNGRGVARSFGEVGGLTDALHRSGMTWMGEPVYAAYEDLLSSGDVASGAAFLRDLVLHRIAGDEARDTLAMVKQPVGGTTFDDRASDFRSLGLLEGTLANSSLRTEAWRGFTKDMQAGLPREEARARIAGLAEALQASGCTYSGYLAPVIGAYADHGAGRSDGADALAFLADLAGRKVHGTEAAEALEALDQPAGRLTLAQRAKVFGDLDLAGRESQVRLAVWAAVRAEIDGGATPEAAAARVQRLDRACQARELTYRGYLAPLFRAWADTCAGSPESDVAVDFLAGLVSRGIHGDDAATVLEEVARPVRSLGLAQRVQEFAALKLWDEGPLGDPRTRVAVWSAFRRDVDGGAAPVEARARVERLAASFVGVTDYHGCLTPVFRAWQDGGAGSADSDAAVAFLAELVAKGIHGADAEKAMAELAQPAGSLTLAERGRRFHDLGLSSNPTLNQGAVRPAVWSAFRADVAAGASPDAAGARLDRLAAALTASQVTYHSYVCAVFEAYRDHSAGTAEADTGLQFLVDVTGKGLRGTDASSALERVVQPAGSLTMAERVQAFHDLGLASEGPLNDSKVRPAVFEAFRTDVAGGADAAVARTRLGRLAEAYAKAEMTYNAYLAEGFATYGRHFAGTADAEVGLQLVALLASRSVHGSDAAALAAEVAQPAGPLTLAERVQALQDLKLLGQDKLSQSKLRTAVYAAFRTDVAGGSAPAAARSRVERLAKALEEVTYEGYLTPVFRAWTTCFAGTPETDGGVAVLEELTKAGIHGEEAAALAAGLAVPFAGLSLGDRLGHLKRLAFEGPEALRAHGVRGAAYEMFRREASGGLLPLAEAEARVHGLTRALEKAGVTYGPTLQAFLKSYTDTLAGEPVIGTRWPIRWLEKGVPQSEILESMELVKRDLVPLLARADTEVVSAVNTLLSRPPRMPWPDEVRSLKSTLEILLGARRGREDAGSIGEEVGEIVIGEIRLPRNSSHSGNLSGGAIR